MAKRPTLAGPLSQATDGVSGPGDKEDKIAREAEKRLARLSAASRSAEAAIEREQRKSMVEEEAEVEAEPQVYVVQTGDTLSKIAGQLLGDPKRWKEIWEANRDQIKNPDLIQVGWKLRIPKTS